MKKITQHCKEMEVEKYWNEFSSSEQSFFKIMFREFKNELTLSRKFMTHCKETFSETICLRGPSGFTWNVKLGRTDDDFILQNGWEKFVKDHDLEESNFLVFRYEKESTFKVTIYDNTGCEREGSYFVQKHKACKSHICVLQSKEKGKRKVHEDLEEKREISLKVDKLSCKGKKRKNTAVNATTRGFSSQKKERSGVESKNATSVHITTEEKKGSVLDVTQRVSSFRTSFVSNRRPVTEKEKRAAYLLSSLHKSKRPFFRRVLKSTSVHKFFIVNIPNEWAREHFEQTDISMKLKVPPKKKEWPVNLRMNQWGSTLTKGWQEFVWDNCLEEYDVCIFELQPNKIVLNVNIFRVVDEVIQPTHA